MSKKLFGGHTRLTRVCLAALTLTCLTACRPVKPHPGGVPARIVSLAPNLTEILFAIGAGEQVVGVTKFCRYPPEAPTRAIVGDYYNWNYEVILLLKPDLIVTCPSDTTALPHFQALNLPFLTPDTSSLNAIQQSILSLGQATGHYQEAERLSRDISDSVESVTAKIPFTTQPCSVILVITRNVSLGNLTEVGLGGAGTLHNEILYLLKAVNAYDGRLSYAQITYEGLLQLNPDVIIELAPDLSQAAPEVLAKNLASWNVLTDLEAVKNSRVYLLTDDYISTPGPRVNLIVADFAKCIYPDIFPEESLPNLNRNGVKHDTGD